MIRKWNLLPTEIKTAPSLDSFKNRLDEISHWKPENNDVGTLTLKQCQNMFCELKVSLIPMECLKRKKTMDDLLWLSLSGPPEPEPNSFQHFYDEATSVHP